MKPPVSLSLRDLTVAYGSRVVIPALSLDRIAGGRITTLVGPNGSGKSTLLRAIAGLARATGSIRLNGDDLQMLGPARRACVMAYLPQDVPARSPLLVLETAIAAFRVADATRSAGRVERSALAALARLGILDLALEPLDRLSGGQRQLAALAPIVGRSVPLVLLDEPTSALDLRSQLEVMAVVRALADEGAAVLMVLHDLAIAARWADQIVVLDKGRIHTAAAPADALTPEMFAAVYRIEAHVRRMEEGELRITALRPLAASPESASA